MYVTRPGIIRRTNTPDRTSCMHPERRWKVGRVVRSSRSKEREQASVLWGPEEGLPSNDIATRHVNDTTSNTTQLQLLPHRAYMRGTRFCSFPSACETSIIMLDNTASLQHEITPTRCSTSKAFRHVASSVQREKLNPSLIGV